MVPEVPPPTRIEGQIGDVPIPRRRSLNALPFRNPKKDPGPAVNQAAAAGPQGVETGQERGSVHNVVKPAASFDKGEAP